jgi:hypothetical protein
VIVITLKVGSDRSSVRRGVRHKLETYRHPAEL